MKNSKLKNRILFLSPTVQAGWETESHKMDFQFISVLGTGSFGTVHKVKHKKTGSIYAIKQMKKNTLDSIKLVEHARTEVKIMYSINNNHIIKLYNHFEDEISLYLVLEFAEGGQLYQKLKSSFDRKFSEELASQYICQIGEGLKALHFNKIMHRDIKPENILLDKEEKMKIADFGWSHFLDHGKRTTFCGTLDYLAPEMLEQGHEHDYRVDIWSLGVLIYQLCTGQSPFSSELIKNKTITEELVKNNIKFVSYKFPTYLSKLCRDLISKILVSNPQNRPSISQILNHPWIKNYEKKQLHDRNWEKSLTNDMKNLFPQAFQLTESSTFSKQQIYQFSRPESIINIKPKRHKVELGKGIINLKNEENKSSNLNKTESKISYHETKKFSELQLKITELEVQHKYDKQQISKLKSENEKLKCSERQKQQLMKRVVEQMKIIENMDKKIAQLEKSNQKQERHNH